MNYLELTLTAEPELSEILIAELADIGFEAFVETEDGLQAYIPDDLLKKQFLDEIFEKYYLGDSTFSLLTVEKKNWNAEWEKSYESVRIDNQVLIRASFHESENYPYEIVINPKMSFGTGHHETTELMLRNQLSVSHKEKTVIDVGCGTGILAIMAAKLGATKITAFDIEDWAVENTKENTEFNHCTNIFVGQGTIQNFVFEEKADIILANINRNILLEEMQFYVELLKKNGYLLFSGFYEQDLEEILQKAQTFSLEEETRLIKNNWVSLRFIAS